MKNGNPKKYENILDWAVNKRPIPVEHSTDCIPDRLQEARPFVFSNKELADIASEWSADHIVNCIGEIKVKVYVSADGTFPGGRGPYDPKKYLLKEMDVNECVERILGQSENYYICEDEKYYIYQIPLSNFDKLSLQIDFSKYVSQEFSSKNFWLGGPGNITPIHYDMSDNLLAQLMGHKKVILWSPQDYARLEFNPIGSVHDRQSRVDSAHATGSHWPEVKKLETYHHNLRPGDILYIPYSWPHFVYTESLSASLNFWWTPKVITDLMQTLPTLDSIDARQQFIKNCLAETRPELAAMIKHMASDGSLLNLLEFS